MIEFPLFLKAMGIGAAIAAPVGPMSLLCMRTTLAHGWRRGLAIGGGIAVGDGLYGIVAALGLAGLSGFLLDHAAPLHVVAGLVLVWLGWKTLRAPISADNGDGRVVADRSGREFLTAIGLTLTNPPTILTFAALLTALAPPEGLGMPAALATVAGVFTGSLLWWILVVSLVMGMRHVLGTGLRLWIDRVSGLALLGLGLLALWNGVTGPWA